MALTWTRSSEWDSDDWRKVAACRDTDPDLFFPIGTTGQAIEQIDAAKAVCFTCEVRDACLEFALATNQESGVWGATSEDERRKLRKASAGRLSAAAPGLSCSRLRRLAASSGFRDGRRCPPSVSILIVPPS